MMPLFVNPVGFNFTTIDARSSPIFQISGHYEAQRHVEVCVCGGGGGETYFYFLLNGVGLIRRGA